MSAIPGALRWLAVLLAVLAHAFAAAAEPLPPPGELERRLGLKPQRIAVIEPHMSTPGPPTRLEYVGWPAPAVLDALLPTWKGQDSEIEFRALDGYVAWVPAARLAQYAAFLVFARADGSRFEVHNIAQNEKGVPLGPYYLVWDNIRHGDLLKDGATSWPYQISHLRVVPASLAELLPAGLEARYGADARLTRKLCLSCHQLNGFGGEKHPIDLAERARDMSWADFRRQTLRPRAANPQATMPPLLADDSPAAREAAARRIYDYLRALPPRCAGTVTAGRMSWGNRRGRGRAGHRPEEANASPPEPGVCHVPAGDSLTGVASGERECAAAAAR